MPDIPLIERVATAMDECDYENVRLAKARAAVEVVIGERGVGGMRFRQGRNEQWKQGYQCAMKDAVTWLHERAGGMKDHSALHLLHSAATNLGWAFAAVELRAPPK